MSIVRLFCGTLLLLGLLGSGLLASTAQQVTLIVKWSDNLDPRQDASLVQQLEEITETRLRYVRPTSGGAHLLRTQEALNSLQLRQLLSELNSLPQLDYAEEDAPVRLNLPSPAGDPSP
ncbi:hypothetical protein Selin_1586 [Desulfurispirillum indicum S5]|uniref:Uncharacterized protein n=1 Tax=Desulfurispirillum indicum (strain ATCC BAA-1389 / DSM 22839 / S5) TaxID=653733 RepID=E6W098_DESIS|nr:hypothetical protein [Desulfurispirillum indicum]ADU66316.1 hypothetical protein Selin_1586 [Desulfurispirillum indicum S5]